MIDAKYIVVGSGIFGAVVAELIASNLNEHVLVVERRDHIGGNCYSAIDPETGIEFHCYGSHIFHTSNEKVWQYINRFSGFTNYRHKVLTVCDGKIYFMPINLKTICDVLQKNLTPKEADEYLKAFIKVPESANNLEDRAISLVGKELYLKLIHGYTVKQWEKDPKELAPEIISRLPIRLNFNTDYFDDPHQGVPTNGYFKLFENLLSHPNIKVLLNTDFSSIRSYIHQGTKVIYTGTIDGYFDRVLGALEYRTLRFEKEIVPVRDFQGTAVVNYGDIDIPYTRIHEFKHYHPERKVPYELNKTVICREYPSQWTLKDEAYYPINTPRNEKLLAEYQKLAAENSDLFFGGRLGTYRYLDMDKAVSAAFDCYQHYILRS